MRHIKLYLCCSLLCFTGKLFSQVFLPSNVLTKDQGTQFLFLQSQGTPLLKIQPVRHEAFFCKLEDQVHAKFTIWVKFRAGSDEIYRKMIATPREE